jgi:hypothetical protein
MRIAYLHYADTLRFHTDPTPEEIADIERDPGVHALGLNLRGRDPVVYYIKIGNHIKIGYTTDLATRMAALQPDHIFGTERGDRDLERQRHEQFAHLRSKGREYFDPADDLMAHIIEVCIRPKESGEGTPTEDPRVARLRSPDYKLRRAVTSCRSSGCPWIGRQDPDRVE